MDAARRAGETRPGACVNVVDLKSNGERLRMDTSPELVSAKSSRPVKWRCVNCARPLGSAMAVCAHCEPEFAASDPFRVRERMHLPALHHCPACRAAFDVPDVRLEPEQAPWWRPQAYVYCCPACRLRLDWRPQTLMARSRDWAFFGLFALYVGMSMESWHYSRAWLWGLLALNGIAFCLALASSFGPQQQPGAGQLSKSGAAASSARRLALGRFVAHGVEPNSAGPWWRWLLMALLLVFVLCANLFKLGRGTVPGVAPGIMLASHAVVTCGLLAAVVWAQVLRRRALRQLGW